MADDKRTDIAFAAKWTRDADKAASNGDFEAAADALTAAVDIYEQHSCHVEAVSYADVLRAYRQAYRALVALDDRHREAC